MMKTVSPATLLWLSALLLLGPGAAAAADAGGWLGQDGRPLPFADDEDALEFLRRAEILSSEVLTSGINRPSRMRLSWNGVEAHAIFRTVDIRKRRVRLETRMIPDFHDSHIYECAAYELARALELDNVPPCVRRTIDHQAGTLQLWVEGAMMERQRREQGKKPPVPLRWARQKQTMRLFDALISNFDRNQTNMLIDESWKLWFVDHTRSFLRPAKIEGLVKIIWCERQLWRRLQELDREQLSRLEPYVTGSQIKAVLKRRDGLVDHLRSLIDEHGEGSVLYDAGIVVPAEDWLERAAEVVDDYPEASTVAEPVDGGG